MKKSPVCALLVLLVVLFVPACQSQGMIQASNIDQTLVPVLDRHEKFLTGQLDPATITAEDKISFRRSGYLLRVALDTAMGRTPPPPPAGLVVTPTQPIPPGQ